MANTAHSMMHRMMHPKSLSLNSTASLLSLLPCEALYAVVVFFGAVYVFGVEAFGLLCLYVVVGCFALVWACVFLVAVFDAVAE